MPLQPPGYSVSLFLLPDTSRRDGIRERRRFRGLPIPCSSPEKLERHHPKPVGCPHDQSRSQRHSLHPMRNSGTQADSICFLDCRTHCHGNGGSCLQSCWEDRVDFIMSALTPSLWRLNPVVEALCSLGTWEDPPRRRGQEQVKEQTVPLCAAPLWSPRPAPLFSSGSCFVPLYLLFPQLEVPSLFSPPLLCGRCLRTKTVVWTEQAVALLRNSPLPNVFGLFRHCSEDKYLCILCILY